MAGRSGLAVGDKRDGSQGDKPNDISGLDAGGNEAEDVQLEDAPARLAPNLEDDDDDREELDRARESKSKPPVFTDPRDAIAAAYRARKAAGQDGAGGPSQADEDARQQPAAPGEVEIIGRDGKVIATSDDEQNEDEDDVGTAAPGEVEIISRNGTRIVTGEPGVTVAQDDTGDTRQPAASRGAAKRYVEDDDNDRVVRMKVDGVDVEMTIGEMRQRGQMFIASEKRLRDANALLDRARETAATASDRTAAPGNRDQDDPAPTDRTAPRPQGQPVRPKIDSAKLVEKVRKVQLGDDQDASEAFADAVSDVVMAVMEANGQTGAVTRDQVRREVISVNAAERIEEGAQEEVNRALSLAAGNDADVLGDKRYQGYAFTEAFRIAADALRKIGVPEEDLRQPAEEVFYGYAKLRQDQRFRGKLPELDSVFDTAAVETRKVYELPAPRRQERDTRPAPRPSNQGQQPRIVRSDLDRSGRKGRVSVQPRSGSIRADYSGNGAAPAKTSHSDTIAAMAKSRGQYAGLQ